MQRTRIEKFSAFCSFCGKDTEHLTYPKKTWHAEPFDSNKGTWVKKKIQACSLCGARRVLEIVEG